MFLEKSLGTVLGSEGQAGVVADGQMLIASSSGTETIHDVQPTRGTVGLARLEGFRLVEFDQRRIVGGVTEGGATTTAAATATEDGGY